MGGPHPLQEMKAAHAEDHAVGCSCQSTVIVTSLKAPGWQARNPQHTLKPMLSHVITVDLLWRRGNRTPQQCARLFVSTTGSVLRVSATRGVAPPQRATTPADPTLTPDWLYGPAESCGLYSAEHLFGARGRSLSMVCEGGSSALSPLGTEDATLSIHYNM